MTPSARIQALIELMKEYDSLLQNDKQIPADAMIGQYFRKRKYIGSKDKAYISAMFYYILRYNSALRWLNEQAGGQSTEIDRIITALILKENMNIADIQALFNGERYAPDTLTRQELQMLQRLGSENLSDRLAGAPAYIRYGVPEWIYSMLLNQYKEITHPLLEKMLGEAPVDIRVNILKSEKQALQLCLTAAGINTVATPYASYGLRLAKRAALFALPEFRKGWFEMQDEGSQLIAELIQAKAGQCVIDFCAGAGGKSLAIAATMKNKGKILAWDTSERRLSELPKRLRRAGVDTVETHVITSETDSWIKRHKSRADWVLVDAPCSGSGTWRRNPDLKLRTTEAGLQELCGLQAAILDSAARLVKQEGYLVYATCSLFQEENQQQMEAFLTRHPNFIVEPIYLPSLSAAPLPYLSLNPLEHKTDGFFAVIFRRQLLQIK